MSDFKKDRFRTLRQTLQIAKSGIHGLFADAATYEKPEACETGGDE